MNSTLLFGCLILIQPASVFEQGIADQPVGSGTQGFAGDGGPAAEAQLNQPFDVAFDGQANLYFTDTFNQRIRQVDAATGRISTIAGSGKVGFDGDGGPATQASLNEPYGLVVDPQTHDVYFADRLNRRVRRVDGRSGIITTIAGNGTETDSGDGGLAVRAGLIEPNGVALDPTTRLLYIADVGACRIRAVDLDTGHIQTVAGTGRRGHSGDGGPAPEADLHGARAVEVDPNQNLWIIEREGNRLRRVSAEDGTITTVAGNGKNGYEGDAGPPALATFRGPKELAVTVEGRVLIVDTENHAIRCIDLDMSTISSLIGDGQPGATGMGGPAGQARLDRPHGVAVAPDGSIWVADTNNHRLVRIAAASHRPRASTPGDPAR